MGVTSPLPVVTIQLTQRLAASPSIQRHRPDPEAAVGIDPAIVEAHGLD
jgi:hypothetical protein